MLEFVLCVTKKMFGNQFSCNRSTTSPVNESDFITMLRLAYSWRFRKCFALGDSFHSRGAFSVVSGQNLVSTDRRQARSRLLQRRGEASVTTSVGWRMLVVRRRMCGRVSVAIVHCKVCLGRHHELCSRGRGVLNKREREWRTC